MPNNKLSFFRYMLIDRMLRNRQKPYPSLQELLDACEDKFGVRSISTLEKDLAAMRLDFNAPIKYSKLHRGYFYTDESYRMMAVNLSDEQLNALEFVEGFLEQFKAFPIFSEFSSAVDRVIDGLEITRNFNNSHRSMNQFMQIDKSPYFKGKEILSGLIKVISEQRPLTIAYRKFGSNDTKDYTLHPYFLKEFDNLWYLIGYVEDYKEIRTFAIDRIEHFQAEEEMAYFPPEQAGFSADRFFEHCYGITNGPAEHVELRFSPYQGNYVKARPIHPSLTILADTEQEFRVGLHVVCNYELKSWILGFGAQVQVLAPQSLRKAIEEEWKKASQQY